MVCLPSTCSDAEYSMRTACWRQFSSWVSADRAIVKYAQQLAMFDCNDVQGSVQRVSLTVPYSKTKETSNMVTANLPNPRSGVVAPATTAAMPRPSGYLPPARPVANSASLATNPSQPGFPSALPQPTDPRRAAAAKLANPTTATQIGRYPGSTGTAPAAASGSGQYPMAATGLGVAGGSGQFGAGLPADPRPDPRKAARGSSAFRPAGGFPGLPFSYFLTHVILSVPCPICVTSNSALFAQSSIIFWSHGTLT